MTAVNFFTINKPPLFAGRDYNTRVVPRQNYSRAV
jgi:hypothetical protein